MAGLPVTLMPVGLVVSAIVGYITVKFFVRYLAAHSLEVFAYYRFALAAVTVVWLLTRMTLRIRAGGSTELDELVAP